MTITVNARILSVFVKAQKVTDDLSDDVALLIAAPHQMLLSLSNNGSQGGTLPSDPEKPSKQHWKKPKDMPRRPLSAYNLFFKSQRHIMVSSVTKSPSSSKKSRGKSNLLGIGFGDMARTIATKWKTILVSEKSVFEGQARVEMARYRKEMAVWRMKEAAKKVALKDAAQKQKEQEAAEQVVSTNDRSIVTSSRRCDTDDATFSDASDITGQSLHMLTQYYMQETISMGEKQLYAHQSSKHGLDHLPLHSLFSARSMFEPFDPTAPLPSNFSQTTTKHHHQTKSQSSESHREEMQSSSSRWFCPSVYEPLPLSYWNAAQKNSALSSDNQSLPSFFSEKTIVEQEPGGMLDDLSLFMITMEADDF